jgi:hypothetical protein
MDEVEARDPTDERADGRRQTADGDGSE